MDVYVLVSLLVTRHQNPDIEKVVKTGVLSYLTLCKPNSLSKALLYFSD
jgi:hypothetical protein